MREPIMWGSPNEENVHLTDFEDAVEEILEDCQDCDDFPGTILVSGYAPAEINYNPKILERLLEDLDDEYGDDTETKPTPAMLEAEKVFLAAVYAEYQVCVCEEVRRVEVDVAGWRNKGGDVAEFSRIVSGGYFTQ